MTPTLIGRWQTRLWLLGIIGLAVTLIFGRIFNDFTTPLALLGYVLVIGFLWDILYNFVQNFRWDRDWPPVFQLVAGIVEGAFLWGVIVLGNTTSWFGGLPGVAEGLTLRMFLAHYATVWFTTFLATQGLLRIIYPRWRFHGGQWM